MKNKTMITLYKGDCLIESGKIENGSVDLILTDLPYGTTACSWDEIIPLEPMWKMFYRVLRPNGFIVLTASQPFTSKLVSSNIDKFSHQWIWEKVGSNGNPLLANMMPLKNFEDVLVFSNPYPNYDFEGAHPLRSWFLSKDEQAKELGIKWRDVLGNQMAGHYFTRGSQFCIPTKKNYEKLKTTGLFDRDWQELKDIDDDFKQSLYEKMERKYPRIYNPQKTEGKAYTLKQGRIGEAFGGTKNEEVITENNGDRYPKSILRIGYCKDKLHPTQKPVELMEYLIKTYTNEGMTVFDATMGSGSTGVACINTNRNFIGIEMNDEYFNIAKKRIENNSKQTRLF